ncbi:hypothetical protein ACWDR3_00645 [Streptomyces sp. NPDC001002]
MTALTTSGELFELSGFEFDRLDRVSFDGPQVLSAAGRLWAALKARDAGRLRARWPSSVVEAEAGDRAMASLGTRRAAALDALALSRLVLTRQLGLTATELIWYQAYTACVVGDTGVMLRHLERLPRSVYAARIDLLLARLPDIVADNSLTSRAAAQLRSLADQSLEAEALLVALQPRESARATRIVVPYADLVGARCSDARVGAAARCLVGTGTDAPPAPEATDPSTVRALFGYLTAREGGRQGGRESDRRGGRESAGPEDLSALKGLAPVLLDDLVDHGGLSPRVLHAAAPGEPPPWSPEQMSYLRCRLTPGEASEADLAGTGFTAERARRAYLAHDRAELDTLPDTDTAVLHYRALDLWRRTGRAVDLGGLRPEAVGLARELARLRATIAAHPDEPQLVPAAVAADPSCWRMLGAEARSGSLRAGDTTDRDPRLAEWLDLWRLTGLVLDGRWTEAAAEGDALAVRAADSLVRAEALNLSACARAEQADEEGALSRLDEALALRESTALLVNASLVSAERSVTAALPYLARIIEGALGPKVAPPVPRENTVRAENALAAAIGHWQADSELDDCPPELVAMVRAALGRAVLDTALHRLLLTLAAAYDHTWLAAPGSDLVASGSEQQAQLRYYRTRAQSWTPDHETGLSDVADVLVELAHGDDAYTWVDEELRALARLLDEGVHCEFGKAIHLVPTIEVLLRGEVLEPVPGLVLGAQAAAHLTVYLADIDEDIRPAAEHRLLLGPCGEFLDGSLDLPEPVDEALREEISRCLCVCAIRALEATQRIVGERGEELARLADTGPIPVGTAGGAFSRRLAGLLDDVDECVARLRAFGRLLAELPQHESARKIAQMLTKAVLTWSAETTRLRAGMEGTGA